MVKVTIKSDNIIIDVEKGVTLLQVIRKAGIDIAIECGGFGVCGKDRVIVLDGQQNLTPLTNAEFRHFSKDDISKGYRLACQAKVLGGSPYWYLRRLGLRRGVGELLVKALCKR